MSTTCILSVAIVASAVECGALCQRNLPVFAVNYESGGRSLGGNIVRGCVRVCVLHFGRRPAVNVS